MNRILIKLLCGVLMLAMPMVLFAKKSSKNDTIYRPLFTAFELNIGGAAWVEKPLSYFTFNGANISLSLEMMQAISPLQEGSPRESRSAPPSLHRRTQP